MVDLLSTKEVLTWPDVLPGERVARCRRTTAETSGQVEDWLRATVASTEVVYEFLAGERRGVVT